MSIKTTAWAAALAATLFASANAPMAGAQEIHPAAQPKGHYAGLDKLPDWGGVWTLEPGVRRPPMQLKGAYLQRYQQAKAEADANHGEFSRAGSSYCAVPGMPYQMGVSQYPTEFLFTPGRVTLLFEAWTQVRRIYTDGRKHPEDLEATFYGDSIGRWEGDTLVVDTVGIKPGALLAQGMGHSDKEHIIERIHLAPDNADVLIDEMTIEDPEALAQTWSGTYRYRRHRDWNVLEYVCAENDRNPVGADGHAGF